MTKNPALTKYLTNILIPVWKVDLMVKCNGLWAAVSKILAVWYLSIGGITEAFSATITYTSYSVQYYDGVHATAPNDITALAGQIKLTGVSGAGFPSTVLAWCVDIYHALSRSGTFTVETPQPPLPTLTGAQNLLIGGLMLEGNALLAGSNTTFNGHTYTKNDISAATQVAIWSVEYSNLTYSITSNSSLSKADFSDLVNYLKSHAGSAYWTLLASVGNNQSLGTVSGAPSGFPVPGPLAGAGLPGICLMIIGLFWARRRSRPSKTAP